MSVLRTWPRVPEAASWRVGEAVSPEHQEAPAALRVLTTCRASANPPCRLAGWLVWEPGECSRSGSA